MAKDGNSISGDFDGIRGDEDDPDTDNPDAFFSAGGKPRTYASEEEEKAAREDNARRMEEGIALTEEEVRKAEEAGQSGPSEREQAAEQAEAEQTASSQRLRDATADVFKQEQKNKDPRNKPKNGQGGLDGGIQTHPLTWKGWFIDTFKNKIFDKGSYFKFKPDQKNLEAQIMALILRHVFEKGHTEIRFYRKRQIDMQISAQAEIILHKLKTNGIIPAKPEINIVRQRLSEPEPWLGWLGRLTRDWRNERFEKKLDRDNRRGFGRRQPGFLGAAEAILLKGGRGQKMVKDRFGSAALPPAEPPAASSPGPAAAAPPSGGAGQGAGTATPPGGPHVTPPS